MNNYRMTFQRRLILEELRKTKKHPTASEVYQLARKRIPDISMGTVYRNLAILIKQGEVQRVGNGSKKERFDGNPDKHFHIKCTECGRVDDIPEGLVESIKRNMNISCDYKITGYNLFFYGLCPDWKKRQEENNGRKNTTDLQKSQNLEAATTHGRGGLK
jgi:Fur family transcriptional regulator, ferric uptake regulator